MEYANNCSNSLSRKNLFKVKSVKFVVFFFAAKERKYYRSVVEYNTKFNSKNLQFCLNEEIHIYIYKKMRGKGKHTKITRGKYSSFASPIYLNTPNI